MNNQEFFNFVKQAHAGQKRWQGQDYFEFHCMVVADYAINNYKKLCNPLYWDYVYNRIDLLYNIGIAHDLIEDTNTTISYLNFDLDLCSNINILTRRKSESYCEYINMIAKSNNLLAKIVKLSDLSCNMVDLNPGSRKDKYELAYSIIRKTTE